MSDEQKRHWQSKLHEYQARLAIAKTCKYSSHVERKKELDRLGAAIRHCKARLKNPQQVRDKNRVNKQNERLRRQQQEQLQPLQLQQKTMSHKKNKSVTFVDEEEYNEPRPVETPTPSAAGAAVPFSGLLVPSPGISARELYQIRVDALKRKHDTNTAAMKSLSENDRRVEENDRRLEERLAESNRILAENNAYYRQINEKSKRDEDDLIAHCEADLGAIM